MNTYMCREDKENLVRGGGDRVGDGAEAEAGAAVEGGSGNVHAVEVVIIGVQFGSREWLSEYLGQGLAVETGASNYLTLARLGVSIPM